MATSTGVNRQNINTFSIGVRLKLFWIPLAVLTVILVGCVASPEVVAIPDGPTPTPPGRADLQILGLVELVDANLTAPVMPPNPALVDIGAETYFQICLACHGDWGQGLTDEWRATWGEDQNCWKSKCHATNHPPWGFELVRSVPPVLGSGSLARYHDASELYQHVATTMPWWNPGSLTEEQAWGVTAYLLQERGELSEEVMLNDGVAPIIRMHVPASQPAEDRLQAVLLVIMLSLVIVALTLGKSRSL